MSKDITGDLDKHKSYIFCSVANGSVLVRSTWRDYQLYRYVKLYNFLKKFA
jgi:hypothetical protein